MNTPNNKEHKSLDGNAKSQNPSDEFKLYQKLGVMNTLNEDLVVDYACILHVFFFQAILRFIPHITLKRTSQSEQTTCVAQRLSQHQGSLFSVVLQSHFLNISLLSLIPFLYMLYEIFFSVQNYCRLQSSSYPYSRIRVGTWAP